MLAAVLLAAALSSACAPQDGLQAICGPVASEDLARIPGTRWLVASGLNIGQPAHLYLIDTRGPAARILFPRDAAAPSIAPAYRGTCPAPLDPARMSLDGLGMRPGGPGQPPVLFAANHGDRHAIEVFRIDLRGDGPALRWIGCVPLPRGTLANAVVPLADGGLLASSFHDPDDGDAWNRMDRGEATGGIWEWQARRGWTLLTPAGVPGANGLELSADGRTLYASAWASRQLLVIDRASGSQRAVPLDFRPDNIHRAPDGSLLLAGQRAAVRDIAACGASCPQPWVVARFDPRTDSTSILLSGPGSAAINYACGAIEADGRLYITLRGDARIAWTQLPGASPRTGGR